ncbi:MAG: hypothetical protein HOK67_19310, partial [Deltaproteobacteria bacterium]|nr:hypothetical protein [Deltaproteobacteria bacterium]
MHYQLPPIRSLGQLILVALVICLLRPTADARVVEHRFYSPEAQGERSVNVYLPPGYDDNPWRYPVVYGMPPGNDGWEGISSGLMSDAGRMIDTGEISPLIIVQLGAPPPLRYLIHDLMPSVEQSFRVLPVRQYRAVYGHSASGRVPFQLAMNGPGSFGIIGSFAFGFREALDSSVEEYSRIYEQYPLRIYLFADDKDDDGTASRLQELGWDHTFVAGRGHTPDAAERRAFLRFLDEQMSRVRMLQPPRLELRTDTPLVVGNAADLTLAIRPALLDGSSQIDRITADLSAIGGPVALPLARQADGSHRGTAAFTVSGPNGLKSLVLHMIQGGREQPSHFEMVESVAVQPAEDLAILDDGFAAGWQTTGLGEVTFGEAPPGYQGASAGMVEAVSQSNADWLLTLTSDAPISVVGYKALRLAFHPDEAISPGSHLAIGVQGRWFRLVEEP